MLIDYLNEENFNNLIIKRDTKQECETIFNELISLGTKNDFNSKGKILTFASYWINEFSSIMVQMFREKLQNVLMKMQINNRNEFLELVRNQGKFENFLNIIFVPEKINISNNFIINQEFHLKYLEMLSFYKLYFSFGFENSLKMGMFDEDLFGKELINVDNILLHALYFLNYNIKDDNGNSVEIFLTKHGFPIHYFNFDSLNKKLYFSNLELPQLKYSDIHEENSIDIEFMKKFMHFISLYYQNFNMVLVEQGSLMLKSELEKRSGKQKEIVDFISKELNSYNILTFLGYMDDENLISFQALVLLNDFLPLEYKINLINRIIRYVSEKENLDINELKDLLEVFSLLAKYDKNLFVLDLLYNFAIQFDSETIEKNVLENPYCPSYINNPTKGYTRTMSNEDVTKYFTKLKNSRYFIQNIHENLTLEEIDNFTNNDEINFNIQDIRGFTPVMIAAFINHEYFLNKLLERNVNLNIINFSNRTVLDYVVLNNNIEFVEILLNTNKVHKSIIDKAINLQNETKIDNSILNLLIEKYKG